MLNVLHLREVHIKVFDGSDKKSPEEKKIIHKNIVLILIINVTLD